MNKSLRHFSLSPISAFRALLDTQVLTELLPIAVQALSSYAHSSYNLIIPLIIVNVGFFCL